MVAVCRRRGGIYNPFDTTFLCCCKYVERSRYIHRVGGQRVIDGTWYGTQGRLVRDQVYPTAGLQAGFVITDIALNKLELGVIAESFEVLQAACSQVVEYPYACNVFQSE